jgi:hypothetical protein
VYKCPLPPAAVLRDPLYRSAAGYLSYLPDHSCGAEIGAMQIYVDDYLGGNIQFKSPLAEAEIGLISLPYRQAQRNHSRMFKPAKQVGLFKPSAQKVPPMKREVRIV